MLPFLLSRPRTTRSTQLLWPVVLIAVVQLARALHPARNTHPERAAAWRKAKSLLQRLYDQLEPSPNRAPRREIRITRRSLQRLSAQCKEERLARVQMMEEQGHNRVVTTETAVQLIEDFAVDLIKYQQVTKHPSFEWVAGLGYVPHYSGAAKVARPDKWLRNLCLVAKYCYTLLRSKTLSTKREFYYLHHAEFKSQKESYEAIEDLATRLNIPRRALGIVASTGKGVVARCAPGNTTITLLDQKVIT